MNLQQLPAGMYFVGDPCYAIDEDWGDVLEDTDFFRAGEGMYETCGLTFGAVDTKYGDGEYLDQWGNSYPVDAGLLGAVKLSEDMPEEEVEDLVDRGMIMEMTKPFTITRQGAIVFVGEVCIDTDEDEDAE